MPVDSPFADLLDELPVTKFVARVLGSDSCYWVYGDETAATTILFVHGFRGEHHGLEAVIARLRGVRIIAPDLPGFGQSSPLPGRKHDIDGYAEWLAAFEQELGLEGVVVLGHSFGSIIVSHAIARFGLVPSRVILINPIATLASTGPNVALTKLAIFGYKAAARLPERAGRWLIGSWGVVQITSNVLATTKNRTLRSWIHDQHHEYFSNFASMSTVVEGFEASVSNDVGEVASAITAPTLLIGAENDPITALAAVRELESIFPDATLRVIPDVGHLIHYEKAPEAAHFIVDFLGVGSVALEPQGGDRA
jgi:pimeloyl-ACP methyl ester carboxylesterase